MVATRTTGKWSPTVSILHHDIPKNSAEVFTGNTVTMGSAKVLEVAEIGSLTYGELWKPAHSGSSCRAQHDPSSACEAGL